MRKETMCRWLYSPPEKEPVQVISVMSAASELTIVEKTREWANS